MIWQVREGNILDVPADVLICSGNMNLDLSGGVGADLLGRYGMEMQRLLHAQIAGRSPRFAQRGEFFEVTLRSLPYTAVLHAVAVDTLYETSPQVVAQLTEACLTRAAALGARTVAMAALATGYGRMTLPIFAASIRELRSRDFPPLEEVTICVCHEDRALELARAMDLPCG